MIRQNSLTYYTVQVFQGEGFPCVVPHTINDKTGEMYYKFLDKKKANKLADTEKQSNIDNKYRIVKCTETYYVTEWF